MLVEPANMQLTVQSGQSLHGAVTVPGDKSLSHRAALFAALAEGESVIDRFLVSGVTRAMLDALTALGVAWQVKDQRLTVCSAGLDGWRAPAAPLDCRNSATTIRLLAGAIAATGIDATLDGSAGLRRRPMDRIVEPLRQMGVQITPAANGGAPLRLHGRLPDQRLRAIDYTLPVASAQVKSCLLLAALAADAPVTIREPGPSRDHTERMLRAMGVRVDVHSRTEQGSQSSPLQFVANGCKWNGGRSSATLVRNAQTNLTDKVDQTRSDHGDPSTTHSVTIHPPSAPLQPLRLQLAGDISSAAFLIVAALITPGSEILIRDVGLNPTRTGLLDALRAMGADIRAGNLRDWSGEPVGDLTVRHSPLHATRVAGDLVVRMIDEFPIFAVAAACAQGVTEVREAAELRHKESDRITAVAKELCAIGVAIEPLPDGFRITGGAVAGGSVDPHGDHRIAMSCAVAGLVAKQPVAIEGAEIMNESFPAFREILATLGANVESKGS